MPVQWFLCRRVHNVTSNQCKTHLDNWKVVDFIVPLNVMISKNVF